MNEAISIQPKRPGTGGVTELVAEHGSPAHSHFSEWLSRFEQMDGQDIADFSHFLCMLHGVHPGLLDHAAGTAHSQQMREWLMDAAIAFTDERALLTRLTVAAGPVPGIAARDRSETAIIAQREALNLLAQSERRGTATGAATALLVEWDWIRRVVDKVAIRLGIDPGRSALPGAMDARDMAARLSADGESAARAVRFGAEQICIQHQGFWTLLARRRDVRAAAA